MNIIHYRYEGRLYLGEGYATAKATIKLITFQMLKETEHGYWIGSKYDSHFVLKKSRKRFAYPTKEEAWDSFKIRSMRRLEHLERQMDNAKAIIHAIIDTEGDE